LCLFIFPGVEPPRPDDQTRIEFTTYQDATVDYKLCDLRTKFYDAEFKRTCGTHVVRSAGEAIAAANRTFQEYNSKGTFLYFHSTSCNCEHWVVAWKYGYAWSLQINNWLFWTNKLKSGKCQAPGKGVDCKVSTS